MIRAVAALALALVMATGAEAADYKAPRNAYGQPDLQGVWNTHFFLPLEARPGGPPLVVSEAEARAFARKAAAEVAGFAGFVQDPEIAEINASDTRSGPALVRGQWRTRQIVQPADGRLPLAPRMRGQVSFIENILRNSPEPPLPTDGPEQRPNWERCLAGQGQPPVVVVTDISPRQILQTRDAVVLLSEYGPDLRIIPFTDRHGSAAQTSTLGDAIARWEGETLVIETIGLPDHDALRPFPTLFVPSTAEVIERYTRVSDKELLYQFTVVEPAIYTAPWLAEYSLYRTEKPLYEFACHEGNYSLPSILSAARQQERKKP